MLEDVVICNPIRTPIGRYGGCFRDLSATALMSQVLRDLVNRRGLCPDYVQDVVVGQCYPSGESPAIGRVAALDAEFPVSVPGTQIDRRCGSGLQAVIYAAMQVATGTSEVVVAGGAESMSNVEFYTSEIRFGPSGGGPRLHDRLSRARVTAGGRHHPVPGGMIETAENLRRQYHVTRAEQDEWSLRSHERAIAAMQSGRFSGEMVPVKLTRMGGSPGPTIDSDEHPREDISYEALSQLKPIMAAKDHAATVTAGNSSGQNDAAAACVVTTRRKSDELGLTPFVRILDWSLAGVEPTTMGIGPIPAVERVLTNMGLTLGQVDLIELNEAFAAQVIPCIREWGLKEADLERVNVNGSGISLGHPVGATGARILATLAHEMRRRGVQYGLETMCIGGGQGLAALFERVA